MNENNFSNIKIYNLAVAEKNKQAELNIDKYSSGDHSFSKKNVPRYAKSTYVECTSLDDFFSKSYRNKIIDLLKIDTQGAEILIIQGAKKLFEEKRISKIYMEYWPEGIINVSGENNLLDMLKEYGFNISIIEDETYEPKELDLVDILPNRYYDLLCALDS